MFAVATLLISLYTGSVSGSDVGGMYSSNYGSSYVARGSDVSFSLASSLFSSFLVLCILYSLVLFSLGQVGGSSYLGGYSSRSLGSSGYLGGSGSGSYY